MNDADFDLLQIKERLNENLSSSQIADTLDELLMRALKPMIGTTDILESTIVEILPFTATNARRKFSALDQSEFVNHLFSFIVVKNNKAKQDILRRVRMERTLYFKALKNFEDDTANLENYIRDYSRLSTRKFKERAEIQSKIDYIVRKSGVTINSLLQLRNEAAFWHNQASQFKQMVVEKYVRYAYVETKKAEASTSLNISTSDLFKDLIVSISKAIDKYDSQKGPITTYIQWWFMDAKTQHHNGHEYGIVFNVPVAQRKKLLAAGVAVNNLTVELTESVSSEIIDESDNILDSIIKSQDSDIIQRIAVNADTAGFACLLEEIPFTLNQDQQAALKATLQ